MVGGPSPRNSLIEMSNGRSNASADSWTQAQIAQEMNLSLKRVKNYVHKAY